MFVEVSRYTLCILKHALIKWDSLIMSTSIIQLPSYFLSFQMVRRFIVCRSFCSHIFAKLLFPLGNLWRHVLRSDKDCNNLRWQITPNIAVCSAGLILIQTDANWFAPIHRKLNLREEVNGKSAFHKKTQISMVSNFRYDRLCKS